MRACALIAATAVGCTGGFVPLDRSCAWDVLRAATAVVEQSKVCDRERERRKLDELSAMLYNAESPKQVERIARWAAAVARRCAEP